MTEDQKINHLKWADNLIKGRIAEVIFEQMMRGSGRFTVIPFGYEKSVPELANKQAHLNDSQTTKALKRSPDFVIIDNEMHNVFLIEVKFQKHKNAAYTLEGAREIHDTWKPAFLFLATPEGFYFDSVKNIVANKGEIAPFGTNLIQPDMQQEYIGILNKHI